MLNVKKLFDRRDDGLKPFKVVFFLFWGNLICPNWRANDNVSLVFGTKMSDEHRSLLVKSYNRRSTTLTNGLTLLNAIICLIDLFGILPTIVLPRALINCGTFLGMLWPRLIRLSE